MHTLSVGLICYLDATGAETSTLLNCILQGWAIIFGAQELLWEGRIYRMVVPSYESRSKIRFIASALIFTLSWNFQISLNTSAGHWNAVSGHIWPESLYLPTLGILHWIVLTLPTLHTRNSSCFILLRLNPLSQRKLSIVISLSRMLCFGRVCASSCALNVSAALQGAYSCITLLWLHHNHKMSISYHKNGLISSHQTIWKWLYFYVLCNKNILKLVGYQQPTCLCVMTEFVIGSISLSRELRSLSKAAFVHVRPAQLCTENGISIYMCSAVDVVWLT